MTSSPSATNRDVLNFLRPWTPIQSCEPKRLSRERDKALIEAEAQGPGPVRPCLKTSLATEVQSCRMGSSTLRLSRLKVPTLVWSASLERELSAQVSS
ncbi:hypothetical protein TNCV_285941 [Trichonephila clavipes]|nr:hypothetical protein TNCV_285941 [Trichonephila clavipes]